VIKEDGQILQRERKKEKKIIIIGRKKGMKTEKEKKLKNAKENKKEGRIKHILLVNLVIKKKR